MSSEKDLGSWSRPTYSSPHASREPLESGDVSAYQASLVQLALEHDKSIQTLHMQNQTILAELAILHDMLAEQEAAQCV